MGERRLDLVFFHGSKQNVGRELSVDEIKKPFTVSTAIL